MFLMRIIAFLIMCMLKALFYVARRFLAILPWGILACCLYFISRAKTGGEVLYIVIGYLLGIAYCMSIDLYLRVYRPRSEAS